MLEQLGEFEGVVVMDTNRLEALDAAVLRRMDAKVHLEALKPKQVLAMLGTLVQQMGQELGDLTLAQQQRLNSLYRIPAWRRGTREWGGDCPACVALDANELCVIRVKKRFEILCRWISSYPRLLGFVL